MTAQLKSNKTATGTSVLPAGMETYVNRVLADGGQIGTGSAADYLECYTLFKALEDNGFTSANCVAGCGAALGVKVAGGLLTKAYNIWSASQDFTLNAAGANSTLDTSLGFPMIKLDPAGFVSSQRAHLRAANPITGVSGSIGQLAAFNLTNPTTLGTFWIATLESGLGSPRETAVFSAPLGDTFSRIGWNSRNQGTGLNEDMNRKSIYSSRRFFAGLREGVGRNALWQDGVCQRAADSLTSLTYYNGLSLTPTVGNLNTIPNFMLRMALWFNGSVTQTQMKGLTTALGGLS